MSCSTDRTAVVEFQWLEPTGAVLGIITALVTLPPVLLGYFRKLSNWWSLRSRQTAVKGFAELEQDLQKLNEPPPIDETGAAFYTYVLVVLAVMSGGLMSASWYAFDYLYQLNWQKSDLEPDHILSICGGVLLP